MNSQTQIEQAVISVLLSLSSDEPSSSVVLKGNVSGLPDLLNQIFKPELLSLISERSANFMRFEIDITALTEQLELTITDLNSNKRAQRKEQLTSLLMVSDAPFPMMHSIYKMKQGEYRSWRKKLPEAVTEGSMKGGKLKNLSQAEEYLLADKVFELSKKKRLTNKNWIAGELFWELHVQTKITVRQIWAYVTAHVDKKQYSNITGENNV